jgi:uncharacterized LabA/DUF88 family protein
MRVGVYIDGFNLYYGARESCGRSTAGWRWLDVRSLCENLIGRRRNWEGATVERIVYCTARISANSNRDGSEEQDIYLKALQAGGVVDLIEYGHYVARVKSAPLATANRSGKPVLTTAHWPVKVQNQDGSPVPDARFMVSYAHREEKGSDVNVASHLLLDALEERVDGAVVVSNDSDLRLPIQKVRERIPVGTVNPSKRFRAGALGGDASAGAGRHWWLNMSAEEFRAHQLPDPCGGYSKPAPW